MHQELHENVTSTLGLQPPHQCGAGMCTRIAYLNMTDPLQSCPPAWRESKSNGIRVCGRLLNSNQICHGAFYSAGGCTFTKVSGQIIGCQIGRPDAFQTNSQLLDEPYVYGVSIAHGSPRSHIIWTYAADYSETSSGTACSCDSSSSNSPPSYSGNNYYCKSGNSNS